MIPLFIILTILLIVSTVVISILFFSTLIPSDSSSSPQRSGRAKIVGKKGNWWQDFRVTSDERACLLK